jgi:cyclopropane fatty-acyl-phospholipid synthase-like methyltransferase
METRPDKNQSMHYLRYLASIGATDIHPGGEAATRLLLRQLQLGPGMRVLEVGCGVAGLAPHSLELRSAAACGQWESTFCRR